MFATAMQRFNDRRSAMGDSGADAGFTLIELMVVLLILAILLAIAIPTFLGVTKSANDRASQSNLNTAMLNAKSSYQANSQSYGAPNTVNSTVLKAAEPGLSFTTGATTSQSTVSVFPTADGNAIVLGAFSKSNNCWYQIDNPSGSTAVVAATPFSSATATGTNGVSSNPATGALVFPSNVSGTIYVEVKNDTTATDCNAASPAYTNTANSQYQWSTTGFPSL